MPIIDHTLQVSYSSNSVILIRESEGKIDPKARELVLKARLLRYFALVFAVVGLIIFIVLYLRNVQGSFFSAMTNPFMIIMVIFPFLPAVVLSWKAGRLETEYKKYQQKK